MIFFRTDEHRPHGYPLFIALFNLGNPDTVNLRVRPAWIQMLLAIRLLSGEQSRAAQSPSDTSEGYTHRISEAVNQLRENMDQPLRIKKIARELGMSVSGFHYHFKSVTAMSLDSFQKQLRLQEARRLMLRKLRRDTRQFSSGI